MNERLVRIIFGHFVFPNCIWLIVSTLVCGYSFLLGRIGLRARYLSINFNPAIMQLTNRNLQTPEPKKGLIRKLATFFGAQNRPSSTAPADTTEYEDSEERIVVTAVYPRKAYVEILYKGKYVDAKDEDYTSDSGRSLQVGDEVYITSSIGQWHTVRKVARIIPFPQSLPSNYRRGGAI